MSLTSNFGFLSDHDPKLVQLGAFAERYFRDNPPTCLIKLRTLAELVAKLIAAHHALYIKDRETFEERLRRLHYDRIIPREVNEIFHKLRIFVVVSSRDLSRLVVGHTTDDTRSSAPPAGLSPPGRQHAKSGLIRRCSY